MLTRNEDNKIKTLYLIHGCPDEGDDLCISLNVMVEADFQDLEELMQLLFFPALFILI